MAKEYIHKPGKGSLIKNSYKNKDTQPDYVGSITLQDGTVQRIVIWDAVNENTGKEYFNVNISDPRPQTDGPAAPPPLVEMTDDIPF